MELAMLHGIQAAIGCPLLDALMTAFTMMGEHGCIWIVLAACLLFTRKYRSWGVVMIVALAITYVFGMWIVKPLVARPRPFVADPSIMLIIAPPTGYSFPSGHASASFAAATVFCFIPVKKRWKVCAVVLAALIAFSRLYLCVHYPSDVAAGIILGIVFGVCTVWAYRRIKASREAKGGGDVRA